MNIRVYTASYVNSNYAPSGFQYSETFSTFEGAKNWLRNYVGNLGPNKLDPNEDENHPIDRVGMINQLTEDKFERGVYVYFSNLEYVEIWLSVLDEPHASPDEF